MAVRKSSLLMLKAHTIMHIARQIKQMAQNRIHTYIKGRANDLQSSACMPVFPYLAEKNPEMGLFFGVPKAQRMARSTCGMRRVA